jgi:biotin transport system substrate-specific component
VASSSPGMVLADRIASRRSWIRDAGLILAGSALMALTAQVAIPLKYVPITGQTFGVLLVGAALGARRGAASLVLYLLEGAAGLPVFAGGRGGFPVLLGPTGGYLWSYPFAAALVGWLAERGWDRSFRTTALAMLLGNLVIYLFGLPWLAVFIGGTGALVHGFLPFIPGDALKLLLAAWALPTAWKRLGERPRATE